MPQRTYTNLVDRLGPITQGSLPEQVRYTSILGTVGNSLPKEGYSFANQDMGDIYNQMSNWGKNVGQSIENGMRQAPTNLANIGVGASDIVADLYKYSHLVPYKSLELVGAMDSNTYKGIRNNIDNNSQYARPMKYIDPETLAKLDNAPNSGFFQGYGGVVGAGSVGAIRAFLHKAPGAMGAYVAGAPAAVSETAVEPYLDK